MPSSIPRADRRPARVASTLRAPCTVVTASSAGGLAESGEHDRAARSRRRSRGRPAGTNPGRVRSPSTITPTSDGNSVSATTTAAVTVVTFPRCSPVAYNRNETNPAISERVGGGVRQQGADRQIGDHSGRERYDTEPEPGEEPEHGRRRAPLDLTGGVSADGDRHCRAQEPPLHRRPDRVDALRSRRRREQRQADADGGDRGPFATLQAHAEQRDRSDRRYREVSGLHRLHDKHGERT